MADGIGVQVACARPERQVVRGLRLPAGATARQAVLAARLEAEFPDLDVAHCPVGIFGHVVPETRVLRDGDRVEVYWPLGQDPREARRAAAVAARRRGR